MSDTPRTDEEVAQRIQPFTEPFVPASFARELERENAKLREEKTALLAVVEDALVILSRSR